MASTNQNSPYQGYPYVKPVAIDVPSLNPAEVAALTKWNNLPRRQIGQKKDLDNPVVYIDLPEDNGETDKVTEPSSMTSQSPGSEKKDMDPPVVYIDIPEAGSSAVTDERVVEDTEAEFVQETIFYDPFKDRRIDVPRDSDSDSDSSGPVSIRPAPLRPGRQPRPPNSQELNSPGTAGHISTISSSYLSKESQVYGSSSHDDGFPMSPIPVSEFPPPPPAYEEVDSTPRWNQDTRPPVTEQPRTQVILSPNTPAVIGQPHPNRKFLPCQHCGSTVHTLVIKESGVATHMTACVLLLCCLFPLTIVIYCTDCGKYKNHYCPNCNKRIGYQNPYCCCSELQYE